METADPFKLIKNRFDIKIKFLYAWSKENKSHQEEYKDFILSQLTRRLQEECLS